MPTKREQQERRASLRPHPMRDQIIDVMRSYGRPISPTQLARITGGTLGSVAYHMRTLVAAGVVELSQEGRVRGAVEHFYTLAAVEEQTYLTDPLKLLMSLCGALTVSSPGDDYPRPAQLDSRARSELQETLDKLRPRVQAIVTRGMRREDAR